MSAEALTRILHVDDEPDIREVAKLALEGVGGYTVESCPSGAEALRRAPDFAPDLLLLDVMMPGIDGPETLKRLRAMPQFATTPAVFMTAKVQPQEVASYKALGAADVIPKPFNPMTLAEQLSEIWRAANTQAEPGAADAAN